MQNRYAALLILMMILFCIPLSSQEQPPPPDSSGFSIFDIFSYEHPVKKKDDEKKWSLSLGGGYMNKQGNNESMDINYSLAVKFDNNLTTLKLNYLGFYGETKGIKDENRWIAQGNFDYFLVYRLEFFSFTMSDYNEMIGLQQRNDSGAGLKFLFTRNRFLLVDLSGAPVYQYQKFKDMEQEEELRWSLRWRAEIAPSNENFTVRYYSYYIPVFGERDNYRFIQDLYIYFKLGGAMGIKAGYRMEYNTYTPEILEQKPDLKKTDETSYIQLSVTI